MKSLPLMSRISGQPSPSASKKAHAGAQGFRQIFLAGCAGVVREVDAGLRGDVGEVRRRLSGGCAADASSDQRAMASRLTPESALRSSRLLHGRGPSRDSWHAFVVVDRLALVVVFGAEHARRLAVMACDDSSALKRWNSFCSRCGAGRVAQAAVAQHQRCSASAHLRDPRRTLASSVSTASAYWRFRNWMRAI